MRIIAVSCVLAVTACAAEPNLASNSQADVVDGRNGGTLDFYFQPPIVTTGIDPATSGGPYVEPLVEIDLPFIDCATLAPTGTSDHWFKDEVQLTGGGYKHVENIQYTPNTCLRVTPWLDGSPLGFRDVKVISGGAAAPPGFKKWGLGTNQTILFKLGNMDPDTDGVFNNVDNCATVANPGQQDGDGDGTGDACEGADADGDGVPDAIDVCPTVSDPDQFDNDGDGVGNACEACDNDPNKTEPGLCGCDQADTDLDGDGIVCDDPCPTDPSNDADGDGICGGVDACPLDPDNDIDHDGVCGNVDNCPAQPNPDQADGDGDGIGDECDALCLGGVIGQWTGDNTADDSRSAAEGVWSGTAGYAPAVVGTGFAFTGTNHVVASFTRDAPWSVSLWARANGVQAKNTGLVGSSMVAQADTFQIDWAAAGRYRIKVGTDTLNVDLGPAAVGFFRHLVVTYTAATITTYADGVAVASAPWAGPLRFTSLRIGVNRGSSLHYNGILDDVAVFDRALSASEVAALHGAGQFGLCP